MKTFYTVRDIEDMPVAGTTEIQIHDDVVLTDVAREKAIALGMRLTPVEGTGSPPGRPSVPASVVAPSPSRPPESASTSPAVSLPAAQPPPATDTTARIKAAVVARLGTHKYDDVLDVIIPQVMAKLRK